LVSLQGRVEVVLEWSCWSMVGGERRWRVKKERERIYPRLPRASLLLCVQVLKAGLGVPWRAGRGQSGGQGEAYERSGRQTSIGRARWW
jgi:hypothetical protein